MAAKIDQNEQLILDLYGTLCAMPAAFRYGITVMDTLLVDLDLDIIYRANIRAAKNALLKQSYDCKEAIEACGAAIKRFDEGKMEHGRL